MTRLKQAWLALCGREPCVDAVGRLRAPSDDYQRQTIGFLASHKVAKGKRK